MTTGATPAGPPFPDFEPVRTKADMSTARFCHLFDMPENTWRRWQATALAPAGGSCTCAVTGTVGHSHCCRSRCRYAT